MKVIGVKYCGGCNPEIERQELVDDLTRLLSAEYLLETGEPTEPWEVAILMCGCPVACLDRPEIRALAQNSILVSGAMVDLRSVPKERLAVVVAEKLGKPVAGDEGECS